MKRLMALLIMTIIGTLATSCTKKQEDLTPVNDDLVKYDLFLDVDATELNPTRKDLLDKINSNNKVSFKAITNELIIDQVKAFEKNESARNSNYESVDFDIRIKEFVSTLDDLSSKIRGQNYFQTKALYEASIEKTLGAELVYNQDYTAVSDITNKGKKQCFSGTHLNLLLQRNNLSGKKFRDANYVVIMTAGHILPGQMIKKGDQWQMFAVETTANGDAIIDYGMASSLKQGMRVIDADYYNMISLYKSTFKDSASAMITMNKALEYTAEKYGIPLDQLEKLVLEEKKKAVKYSSNSRNEENFNSSLFSFGTSTVASGDLDPNVFNSAKTQTFENLRSELIPTKNTETPLPANRYNRTEPVFFEEELPENLMGCFYIRPLNNGDLQLRSYNCQPDMTDVKIPEGIMDIYDSVFSDRGLTSVHIPDSVTSIGNFAFKGNKLNNIHIPDGVKYIGSKAFEGNPLTCVYIPNSVVFIGFQAFDSGVKITRKKEECSSTRVETPL